MRPTNNALFTRGSLTRAPHAHSRVSWWIGVPRERFPASIQAEAHRMRHSSFRWWSPQSDGMRELWEPFRPTPQR